MSLVIEDRTCFSGFCPCLYYNAVLRHVKQDWLCQPCLACILLITFPIFLRRKFPAENGSVPNLDGVRPQYKKVKANLRRCLYECDLSCARCWWLLYGNAEPGPGFPSCPAGSCGIRPDGSSVFYLGWPISDAPVLSGRIHGFQVVINYTNYHQKPAEIFVQITVINNLNSSGTRANIQTT